MSTPTVPNIDGYLDKLKHKVSIFGSWNKRYFRINSKSATLEYFESIKDANLNVAPSGTIYLKNLVSIKQFDELSFNLDAGRDGLYHLKASSKADVIAWLREIGNYIAARDAFESRQIALATNSLNAKE